MGGWFRDLRHRTFRSLAVRNYRTYFFGHTASVIGTWMQRIGQDWLVLELTDSALALGGAMVCQFLPVLLGGVWGGVVVDRSDTRRLLIVAQGTQAVLAAALAVFALTGTATLGIVYALAVALGIVTIFDNPARQSFVAELVDLPDVVNAQALNSLVNNLGRLVGPALAGVLIAAAGVGVTFVINAVSFLAVLGSLAAMDVAQLHPRPIAPRAPGQAREGLRYVWTHPELRVTLALVAVVSVFGQNFRVVFPVLATGTFHGDSVTYGWMTAALGVGAVVGALISAASMSTTVWRLVWTCVSFGLVNLVVAVAPGLTFALVVIGVLGVLNILLNTLGRTILQLSTTPAMRGRVMAVHVMVFLGGIPIGGPLLGVLVELWGPRAGMAVAGVMCLVGCVVVLPQAVRLRRGGPGAAPLEARPAS